MMKKLNVWTLLILISTLWASITVGQDTSRVYLSTNDVVQSGENFILDVNLENPVAIRGVEFYLTPVPNTVTFQEPETTERTDGFMLADTVYNGTTLRILLSDFGGADILPGDGPILRLEYQVGTSAQGEISMNFSNVLVVGPEAVAYPSVSENLILDVYTNIESGHSLMPDQFNLLTNYPNPFNPGTRIQLTLEEPQSGKVSIHNLLGQEIFNVATRNYAAGQIEMYWDGKNIQGLDVPSGIYICQFLGQQVQLKQALILSR